jgi:DNA-binding HxlR family transcriptional regulator
MFRNKKQQKKHTSECAVARVADLVGDTWSILILRDLCDGAKRFGDLASSLSGVSTRTLTKKLQLLESHSIVRRIAYSEKPPRVEYQLTKKGLEFNKIINAMRSYGKKYL